MITVKEVLSKEFYKEIDLVNNILDVALNKKDVLKKFNLEIKVFHKGVELTD